MSKIPTPPPVLVRNGRVGCCLVLSPPAPLPASGARGERTGKSCVLPRTVRPKSSGTFSKGRAMRFRLLVAGGIFYGTEACAGWRCASCRKKCSAVQFVPDTFFTFFTLLL
jgi:hypothetical protein